jgi:hypothetical protein
MQEIFINQQYISDEECTMCNSDEEATLAMEFAFKQDDPPVEMRMTAYFCPDCLEALPDAYFEELEIVDEIEEGA